MTALVLVVGLVPLVGFGATAVVSARRAAKSAAQDRNRHVAVRAAREIDAFVTNSEVLLHALAESLGRLDLDAEQRERVLLGHHVRFRRFARLTLVDRSGALVASTDPLEQPTLAEIDSVLSALEQDEVYQGNVEIQKNQVPRVRLAVGSSRLGEVEYVLVADVDLLSLGDVVAAIEVGKTGRALVLDQESRVLAHGNPDGLPLVVRRDQFPQLGELAAQLADRQEIAVTEGSLGQHALSVAVRLKSTGWTLLLEQDREEAFAQARRLSWLFAALVFVGSGLAFVGGTAQSRETILKPIAALKDAAQQFAAKDFEYRARLETGDELEDLGEALNDMATELGLAYEELALTERARAFGLIAAGLAHDLKHPIGGIQSMEMRTREATRSDRLNAIGEAAERELPKLEEIVRRLRDIGQAGARRDVTFSADRLQSSLDTFRTRADEKDISLSAQIPDDVRLTADANLLTRAIDNLVSNAVEATPSDGEVTLSLRTRGKLAEICVADTGPGIADELRAELFKGFRTTRGSGGGLGIGLHVVHRIAVAHGGRVEVATQDGRGTSITMVLPIVAN